jgi:hypothetical protein
MAQIDALHSCASRARPLLVLDARTQLSRACEAQTLSEACALIECTSRSLAELARAADAAIGVRDILSTPKGLGVALEPKLP